MQVDEIHDASASSSLSGACAIDHTEMIDAARMQIDEDADMAMLLQIEEIIALENQTNGNTTQ